MKKITCKICGGDLSPPRRVYCSDECYKEHDKLRIKRWQQDNKERRRITQRNYEDKNPGRLKQWRDNNKEYQRNYKKNKRMNDKVYAAKERIRTAMVRAFRNKGFDKKSSTSELLGCDQETFVNHVESKFKKIGGVQMTWDNIHIDHIYPLSWCDTEEELIIYSHYSNLQPLLAEDNLKKGNRYVGTPEEYLIKQQL